MDPVHPAGPAAPIGDLDRIRSALKAVEGEAREQPWARERPWRVSSHVGTEGGVVVVDLHDLKAGLARRAVRQVLDAPPEAGAVVFVHGRGRHTLGATQILRNVVRKELQRACQGQAEWSFRPLGAARMAWITDRHRAPSSVTGASGRLVWILLLLLLLAFLVAVAHALGWIG